MNSQLKNVKAVKPSTYGWFKYVKIFYSAMFWIGIISGEVIREVVDNTRIALLFTAFFSLLLFVNISVYTKSLYGFYILIIIFNGICKILYLFYPFYIIFTFKNNIFAVIFY